MTNLYEAIHEELEACPCSDDNICDLCIDRLEMLRNIMTEKF